MKFDREIFIGIIICAVILFGWEPFARKMGWRQPDNAPAAQEQVVPAQPAATDQNAPAQPEVAQPTANPVSTGAVKSEAPAPVVTLPKIPKQPDETLGNKDLQVTIDPNAGSVISFELKEYKKSVPQKKLEGFFRVAKHPELNEPVTFNAAALDLEFQDAGWQNAAKPVAVKSDDGKTLKLTRQLVNVRTEAKLTVIQTWSLDASGYKVRYTLAVKNAGTTELLPEMVIHGGAIESSGQLSGDAVRADSHYLDYLTAAGDYKEIAAGKKDDFQTANASSLQVRWAALSNKYFCTILKSDGTPLQLVTERTERVTMTEKGKEIQVSIKSGMKLPLRKLVPGQEEPYAFDCYCGPKILHNLDAFDPTTDKIMHLSWGPLNFLARGMLWFLVKLNSVIGSYGVCIIILTLLVRLIFYPITARGNASMKKMQAVQPKIKELREKYKDNPQLMNTKMMELYRAEGINPFGGCLPILLQIPVFFALYSTFNGAVELRQSSFLWCHNLAAADTVAYLFSIPINPLVLIMTALMVLQQCLTPMSMEPAQKKMMLLMPIVMLYFFYDLPSGLTLYWTVSNIFSIIQLRLQQRGGKTTEAAKAAKN